MERDGFERWLDGYFAAWISNDAVDVAALFVGDAVYSVGPFAAAWTGRDEIVRRWIGGAQEDVEYAYEILAVEGDTGHRALEREGDERGSVGAGRMGWILWITFVPDGRCREHREWLVRRELPPD